MGAEHSCQASPGGLCCNREEPTRRVTLVPIRRGDSRRDSPSGLCCNVEEPARDGRRRVTLVLTDPQRPPGPGVPVSAEDVEVHPKVR
jgi:hypothetical protein